MNQQEAENRIEELRAERGGLNLLMAEDERERKQYNYDRRDYIDARLKVLLDNTNES